MVAGPWILKMGNKVNSNLKKHALLLEHSSKKSSSYNNQQEVHKDTIGILSFEVANVMSKIIHLHKSLNENEITKLKNEISKFEGVKNLVSSNETYLLEIALAEKLDDLNKVARVVSRLGKKCSVSALQGFEHIYGDIMSGIIDINLLGFLMKDMERMVRKMERYVNSTANLYSQMEVMNELEQAAKKFQMNKPRESQMAFEQKLMWQKQDVRHLKDVSLWNQIYDKIVELLARAVCTIYARACSAFGDAALKREFRYDDKLVLVKDEWGHKSGGIGMGRNFRMRPDRLNPILSRSNNAYTHYGPIKRAVSEQKGTDISSEVRLYPPEDLNLTFAAGPGRLLMHCLSFTSLGFKVDDHDEFVGRDDQSKTSGCCSVVTAMRRDLPNHSGCFPVAQSGILFGGEQCQTKGGVENGSGFGPKSRLPFYAPPSTVGGSALATHYANVIIVIEKLLGYPHLIGEEARDNLYEMLPTSLRMSLKSRLKTYFKDLAIYDAPLAHNWKERLDGILTWLAPLAHNLIRWQSERNFEHRHIVTRTNVLLLQTIYFADREKTEAAISELLVGLNYICRYEHQKNALLDCASSFDLEDCVDWQMHY